MLPQMCDSHPDALLLVDDSGCIVSANQQAERLFGYPAGGLSGLSVEQLMPESMREAHRGLRAGYMADPQLRPMGGSMMSLIGQGRDGQQFPVEIALSPIQDDDGVRILASVRDVSQTRRARQAMMRSRYDALVARIGQLALEAREESGVMEGTPAMLAEALGIEAVAVVFLRPDQDVIDFRASVGFGERVRSLDVSQGEPWLALVQGEQMVIEDLAARPMAEHEWPLPAVTGGSLAMMPMAGRGRTMGALLAQSSEPRRFDHDELHLLRSVATLLAALVQRRRTEEQLAHSQRLDALGQLTGGIAHDFNNLLTIMSGSLQLLEIEFAARPEAQELIASALRSATRGAELTGKLLAFARRQRLTPRAIDPQTLLHDLELMLKGTLGESIHLKVECAEDVPAAYADATQLDTALVNLALNARDAMPRGGEITFRASERWVTIDQASPELGAGHYVVFCVCDTGRGMTPETLARAAEPFFTTKAAGHGTGLGLSMAYGFIKQSGGNVKIESRLGYGTRVELYLPVAPSSSSTTPPALPSLSTGYGETVLVVEDDPEVLSIATASLRSLGYRLISAGNAADALRALDANPSVALLFSDVMLGPGMSGTELAQAARRRRPDLAVLLTSGYDNPMADTADGPAFEMLRKPYRREQLGVAIRRVIGRVD